MQALRARCSVCVAQTGQRVLWVFEIGIVNPSGEVNMHRSCTADQLELAPIVNVNGLSALAWQQLL